MGPAPSPLDIAREGIRVRRGPTATMLFYLFSEKITTGENCEYLDYLALAVCNIRMIFDCDIILGGNVGGYMEGHIRAFESKVAKYNRSDLDTSYIRLGNYKEGSSAIGAGKHMVDKYISNLDKYIGN